MDWDFLNARTLSSAKRPQADVKCGFVAPETAERLSRHWPVPFDARVAGQSQVLQTDFYSHGCCVFCTLTGSDELHELNELGHAAAAAAVLSPVSEVDSKTMQDCLEQALSSFFDDISQDYDDCGPPDSSSTLAAPLSASSFTTIHEDMASSDPLMAALDVGLMQHSETTVVVSSADDVPALDPFCMPSLSPEDLAEVLHGHHGGLETPPPQPTELDFMIAATGAAVDEAKNTDVVEEEEEESAEEDNNDDYDYDDEFTDIDEFEIIEELENEPKVLSANDPLVMPKEFDEWTIDFYMQIHQRCCGEPRLSGSSLTPPSSKGGFTMRDAENLALECCDTCCQFRTQINPSLTTIKRYRQPTRTDTHTTCGAMSIEHIGVVCGGKPVPGTTADANSRASTLGLWRPARRTRSHMTTTAEQQHHSGGTDNSAFGTNMFATSGDTALADDDDDENNVSELVDMGAQIIHECRLDSEEDLPYGDCNDDNGNKPQLQPQETLSDNKCDELVKHVAQLLKTPVSCSSSSSSKNLLKRICDGAEQSSSPTPRYKQRITMTPVGLRIIQQIPQHESDDCESEIVYDYSGNTQAHSIETNINAQVVRQAEPPISDCNSSCVVQMEATTDNTLSSDLPHDESVNFVSVQPQMNNQDEGEIEEEVDVNVKTMQGTQLPSQNDLAVHSKDGAVRLLQNSLSTFELDDDKCQTTTNKLQTSNFDDKDRHFNSGFLRLKHRRDSSRHSRYEENYSVLFARSRDSSCNRQDGTSNDVKIFSAVNSLSLPSLKMSEPCFLVENACDLFGQQLDDVVRSSIGKQTIDQRALKKKNSSRRAELKSDDDVCRGLSQKCADEHADDMDHSEEHCFVGRNLSHLPSLSYITHKVQQLREQRIYVDDCTSSEEEQLQFETIQMLQANEVPLNAIASSVGFHNEEVALSSNPRGSERNKIKKKKSKVLREADHYDLSNNHDEKVGEEKSSAVVATDLLAIKRKKSSRSQAQAPRAIRNHSRHRRKSSSSSDARSSMSSSPLRRYDSSYQGWVPSHPSDRVWALEPQSVETTPHRHHRHRCRHAHNRYRHSSFESLTSGHASSRTPPLSYHENSSRSRSRSRGRTRSPLTDRLLPYDRHDRFAYHFKKAARVGVDPLLTSRKQTTVQLGLADAPILSNKTTTASQEVSAATPSSVLEEGEVAASIASSPQALLPVSEVDTATSVAGGIVTSAKVQSSAIDAKTARMRAMLHSYKADVIGVASSQAQYIFNLARSNTINNGTQSTIRRKTLRLLQHDEATSDDQTPTKTKNEASLPSRVEDSVAKTEATATSSMIQSPPPMPPPLPPQPTSPPPPPSVVCLTDFVENNSDNYCTSPYTQSSSTEKPSTSANGTSAVFLATDDSIISRDKVAEASCSHVAVSTVPPPPLPPDLQLLDPYWRGYALHQFMLTGCWPDAASLLHLAEQKALFAAASTCSTTPVALLPRIAQPSILPRGLYYVHMAEDNDIARQLADVLQKSGQRCFDANNPWLLNASDPTLEINVFIHVNDMHALYNVPNLLLLKNNRRVLFRSFQHVTDYHESKCSFIFPEGGYCIVPDEHVLMQTHPDNLRLIIEFMEAERSAGRTWVIKVQHQVVHQLELQRSRFEETAASGGAGCGPQAAAEAERLRTILSLLTSPRLQPNIVQSVSVTTDDALPRSSCDYLERLLFIQRAELALYRDFFLLTDMRRNDPTRFIMARCGIAVVSVEEFVRTYVRRSANTSSVPYYSLNYGNRASSAFLDACLTQCGDTLHAASRIDPYLFQRLEGCD